jgi:dTDP-4-amino-4,6-dideoxygalactose transaminase
MDDQVTDDQPIRFAVPEITEDDVEAVTRVLRSGWITTGDECLALEAELAEFLSVPYVVTVSSCTAALEIAIAHLRLAPGARVGVPTWTFASTALAAHRDGATPVLLDIDPDTLNLSPDALSDALDEGLDAVIAVHFAGVALDEKVHDLCHQAGVPIIEDAAHALGTRDHRGLVAGQGTAGACYSFYATKNLTSGEGGALATDDEDLAEFARVFRLHGMSRDAWARYHPGASEGYDVIEAGIKANMPDLLAALARSQLRRFDDLQTRRREIVQRYRANLAAIDGLAFIPRELVIEGADHLFVVMLPPGTNRSLVRRRLAEHKIGTSVHFQPLHTLHWFHEHATIARGGLSIADDIAPRALSLPLHPRLTDDDIDRVCAVLVEGL